MKLSKSNYACARVGDKCYYVFEDRSSVCFVSVFPEAMETQVVRVQLDRTLQFQSLLPAYNKFMGGVDRLSQVRKTYVLIENRSDTGYVPLFHFFYYAINNAYLLYTHNCRLFIDVGIAGMVFQVVVPSVELEKLAYREESVATAWMWADVQFITPPLPALFVKFVSARLPV